MAKKERKHFYKNIFGFFDWEDVNVEMVKKAKNGAHFVELGTGAGKSTAHMAVEIINSGKKIKFDTIEKSEIVEFDGKFYNPEENLKPVEEIITLYCGLAEDVVKIYDDESLDFVFIDLEMDRDSKVRDFELWFPKVKIGGYIGTHDWIDMFPGVLQAVYDFFPPSEIKNCIRYKSSMLYKKTFDFSRVKRT